MELAYPMAHPIGRVHPMAGSTRGRTAGRSSGAADSPPTLVVFSKCRMEKDPDLGLIWGPKPRNFSSATLVHLPGTKTNMLATSSVPKFLLVSLIGSLKFNPKGDAILFVSGDFWVQKKMFKILVYQKSKPESYNFKVDAK